MFVGGFEQPEGDAIHLRLRILMPCHPLSQYFLDGVRTMRAPGFRCPSNSRITPLNSPNRPIPERLAFMDWFTLM